MVNDSPSGPNAHPDGGTMTNDETQTLELDTVELNTLKDAVRWQREYAEDNGLRRVQRKLGLLEETIEEQTNG